VECSRNLSGVSLLVFKVSDSGTTVLRITEMYIGSYISANNLVRYFPVIFVKIADILLELT